MRPSVVSQRSSAGFAAHLELARQQVRWLNAQAKEEEKSASRRAAAQPRAARQRVSRLEAAVREVERLQQEKKHEHDSFVARASSSDPEAHVMRNGEGGTVPSYNVQLLMDTQHGIVVNVEATTDAIDYRQMTASLCAESYSVTRIDNCSGNEGVSDDVTSGYSAISQGMIAGCIRRH